MFERVYGMSCVENQVLALLQKRGMDISMLYYDCAIPISALFGSLVECGIRQEYFHQLPKSQDILKELGVIRLDLTKEPNAGQVLTRIEQNDGNAFVLARITPEFVQKSLWAKGLRPDHYVLVQRAGSQIILTNDIPERTIQISKEEFEACYAQEYFLLTINRTLNPTDRERLWNLRTFRLERPAAFEVSMDALGNIDNFGIRLRDLAGVCKLMRYRLAEYYRHFVSTEFIYRSISLYQKYHATFEYYNLKQNIPLKRYYSLLCEMIQTDRRLLEELRRRIA